MPATSNPSDTISALRGLDPRGHNYATQFVDSLLNAARVGGASDVHLQPNAKALEIRWRRDGVLQSLGEFPQGTTADIVSRLKVLANLLTYRSDVPQEGRIHQPNDAVEMRISTFPTLHGERAVVRLFTGGDQLARLIDLRLPSDVEATFRWLLRENSGAILVSGPAGSGKTTTLYACLREILDETNGARGIVSVEDPIEVAVAGVAQSQINPIAGFDLPAALRSVLRQDPEVVLVGEIRDRGSAEGVFGAALTGHLVLTSFHAGSAGGTISRLVEMEIEPYLLRSGILAVLNQRLLRRLCSCAIERADEDLKLGLPVRRFRTAVGCEKCLGTGYHGRRLIAELLVTEPTAIGRAILSRDDAHQLESLAAASGMVTRWQRACELIEQGETSPQEVRRVLGLGKPQ